MISHFFEEVFDRPASPEKMKKCMTGSKPWQVLLSSTFIKLLTMAVLEVKIIYPAFSGRVQHVPLHHEVTHSNEYIYNGVIDRPPRLLFKSTRHLKSTCPYI
jgi:hypothetical protein